MHDYRPVPSIYDDLDYVDVDDDGNVSYHVDCNGHESCDDFQNHETSYLNGLGYRLYFQIVIHCSICTMIQECSIVMPPYCPVDDHASPHILLQLESVRHRYRNNWRNQIYV